MQSRIAQIKRTTSKAVFPAPAASAALPRSGTCEFLRMVVAAVASGIVFGVFSGLVVYVIASHQQIDPSGLSGTWVSAPASAIAPVAR